MKTFKIIKISNFFSAVRIHLPRMAKFIATGVSAAIIDFTIYVLVIKAFSKTLASDNYAIAMANCLGILSGFVWAFVLQKYWTFKTKGKAFNQFIGTTILLIFNMVITSLAIPKLVAAGTGLEAAKVIMQIIVVGWNYFIYHFFIFKNKEE